MKMRFGHGALAEGLELLSTEVVKKAEFRFQGVPFNLERFRFI